MRNHSVGQLARVVVEETYVAILMRCNRQRQRRVRNHLRNQHLILKATGGGTGPLDLRVYLNYRRSKSGSLEVTQM